MNYLRHVTAIGLLLLLTQTSMAGIYKCKTSEGIVYSQIPCATNAEKMANIKSNPTRTSKTATTGNRAPRTASSSSRNQSHAKDVPTTDYGEQLDIALFDGGYDFFEHEEILNKVGPPAAQYWLYDTDHWLYPNAVRVSDGRRTSPELLFNDKNTLFQISWIPEDIVKKNVAIVNGFAGWEPPDENCG